MHLSTVPEVWYGDDLHVLQFLADYFAGGGEGIVEYGKIPPTGCNCLKTVLFEWRFFYSPRGGYHSESRQMQPSQAACRL